MLSWFRKKKGASSTETLQEQSAHEKDTVAAPEIEEVKKHSEVDPSSVDVEETYIDATIIESADSKVAESQTTTSTSEPLTPEPDQTSSLFARLQKGLSKTRKSFVYRLDTLFLGKKEIDQELFDDRYL